MAVAQNTAVATIERLLKRPMPQTPWPLVQPEPRRVPKPTRSPATAITGKDARMLYGERRAGGQHVGEGAEQEAQNEQRSPSGLLRAFGGEQASDDAADPGDAPVEHHQQHGRQADEQPADEPAERSKVLHYRLLPLLLVALVTLGTPLEPSFFRRSMGSPCT